MLIYTKHTKKKFSDLERLGVTISKDQIENTIKKPDHIDNTSDYPNIIASRKTRGDRVIRVVYRFENDKIVIITFYPEKTGRYY